jgi:hypothetical protein
MPRFVRLIGVLAVALYFSASAALVVQAKPKHSDAKHAGWAYETDNQDQPSLSYYNAKGETVFSVACGAHFEMHAVYPGVTKKDGDKASITIANGKT